MSKKMDELKSILEEKVRKVENTFSLSSFLGTDFSDDDFKIERRQISEEEVPQEFVELARCMAEEKK